MKKIGAMFLCAHMLLCGAAYAEDGLVGLWRYEYNDNLILFNLMADNTYTMVISTNDQQGTTLTGRYRASGNAIFMTENLSGGKRIGDFSYVYEINGDIAIFDDDEYVRVSTKPLEAKDFSVSDGKTKIVLDSPFMDFKTDLPEEETSYVGEEYSGGFVYKVYQHAYADFDLYTSNRNYNLKGRSFDDYYISQITLKTPKFKTDRGISAGAYAEDLIKAYGPGEESNNDGTIGLLYTFGDMKLQFDIENQRARSITAFVSAD